MLLSQFSFDFHLSLKENVPFHCTAFDHFYDHIRDVPQKDNFAVVVKLFRYRLE